MALNKTKIEYGNYGWNFYPGCLHVSDICPVTDYCWARGRQVRFNEGDFIPHLIPEKLLDPLKPHKPGKILVNFMGDLFGDWVDPGMKVDTLPSGIGTISMSLKGWIFTTINQCPDDQFLFLTKQPQNLIKWSPFPKNAWVGVSVCNDIMLDIAVDKLEDIQAKVKFISFEPLLERLTLSLDYAFYYSGISWLIVGQQTPVSAKATPRIEWIEEIVEAADEAGCKVFLKNNLESLFTIGDMFALNDEGNLRQEFPKSEEK